ncbi:MAG: hypothetical protein HYZ29_34375 [Myxococcales bacterium]|nr:hypothetical protein [Myxococcales bacterium]
MQNSAVAQPARANSLRLSDVPQDYAEIRSTSDDPLHALRAYCRGEQAGIARAVREDYVAALATCEAIDAMRAAGIAHLQAQAILDWAEHDARFDAPGLDGPSLRALAAIRVRRLVLRAVRRTQGALTEETPHDRPGTTDDG